MNELTSCQELEEKVIKKGLCTLCGACVEVCPYFMAYQGRIVLKDICELAEGSCKSFCPRVSVSLDDMSVATFGVPYSWNALGTVQQVLMARATDTSMRARSQNAGTVTALVKFALEQKIIDSAILTHFKDKSWPEGVIATTVDEVLECSGSSYMAVPIVQTFNEAIRDDGRTSIGFVGTPCQVMALAKMRAAPPKVSQNMDKLKLVIGLFCTWALSYPDFGRLLEDKVKDEIVKYDIPPHPANVLEAYTKNGCIKISLDEVLPYVRPACNLCLDLTAEFADISIGSGRAEVLNWNTVIVRSERGMAFIKSAVDKGVIQTTDIPEANLNRLRNAANNKKRKALDSILKITGDKDNLLYLNASSKAVNQLMELEK